MADLVRAAIQINQEASWEFADRGALVWLSREAAEACAPMPLSGSAGLDAVRLVVRDEIHRAGIGGVADEGVQLDTEAFPTDFHQWIWASGLSSPSAECGVLGLAKLMLAFRFGADS